MTASQAVMSMMTLMRITSRMERLAKVTLAVLSIVQRLLSAWIVMVDSAMATSRTHFARTD